MDIGAGCTQCGGHGRIYAYPGAPSVLAARSACDKCHGTGRNDAHSPAPVEHDLDTYVPGAIGVTYRDLQQRRAELDERDRLITEDAREWGRFIHGRFVMPRWVDGEPDYSRPD